jgi:transposase
MKILALDLGKFKTVACVYDTTTHKAIYETIKMTPFGLHNLVASHEPDRVVFEIGPAAGWVHDVARQSCDDVQVANPNTEGWRWRNVKAKTDRMDALKLARLSAAEQLPLVHMPTLEVRQRRLLIGYRHVLVRRRTRIKARIRSVLHGQGLGMPRGAKGWSPESLARLSSMASLAADADGDQLWRCELDEELDALSVVEARTRRIEKRLDALNRVDARIRRLRTIPGIGPRTAEVLVAMIDDPHRFRRANQLGSYFGLVPRQFESGQMSRQGRITKQGSALARHMLVEAAWVAVRYNPWLRSVYERIRRGSRGRRKIAIVAVARRLLVIAWAMLRNAQPWRMPKIPEAA